MNHKLCYALGALLAFGGSSVFAEKPLTQNTSQVESVELFKQLTQQQAHQAILKMAGEYQVSFHFEEIYALKANYETKPPDLSKAYETVVVLENTPNKISLQHLLMAGSHVIKHWRQDWEYQPDTTWRYAGNYQWQKVVLTAEESKGKWLQTVWQVDDSPRYAGLGLWTSNHGVEAWTSESTYRPLPRRELTTRNDYDTITGVNRHAISAEGWVHEQDNIKYDAKTQTPIAREFGVNQYVRVQNFDFKPAYVYWDKNKNYWKSVRLAWDDAFKQNEVLGLRFTRQKDDDKNAHYMHFIRQAKDYAAKADSDQTIEKEVKKLLNQELTVGQVK